MTGATREQAELATKGEAVEEWVDLHFFRPLGARVARAALPTKLSPDHLTLICLAVGLTAGHLCYYTNPWINFVGFVLFIVSDIFDSADGQLARLRGTSTVWGRVLDGISDNTRFINLYAHLLARLIVAGWAVHWALPLVLFAGITHSFQSSTIDFVRNAFLAIGVGRGGEVTRANDIAIEAKSSALSRLATRAYRGYVARQERLFPTTWTLIERSAHGTLSAVARAGYRFRVAPLLKMCAWLGQNFRFLFIGVFCIVGWPAGVMWMTAIPLNLLALTIMMLQERASARVATTPTVASSLPAQWHTAGR